MLRLHHDGAQAGNGFIGPRWDVMRPGCRGEEAGGEGGEGEIEVAAAGLVEDGLGAGGGLGEGVGAGDPEEGVEGGRGDGGEDAGIGGEGAMQGEGGFASGFESAGELASFRVWEQALGGPESYGGGSGAGTFEGDLAEVEFLRREVGEGGVVLVEAADGGVAEENAAAAVGLQAVLVRVDDERVGAGDGVEGGAGFGREIAGEGEVSAVGRSEE